MFYIQPFYINEILRNINKLINRGMLTATWKLMKGRAVGCYFCHWRRKEEKKTARAIYIGGILRIFISLSLKFQELSMKINSFDMPHNWYQMKKYYKSKWIKRLHHLINELKKIFRILEFCSLCISKFNRKLH